MNDRMTELYARACLEARDIHPTDVPAFIACMAEKFAELIVKECALVTFKKAGPKTALDVLEHFGVEE